MIWGQWQYIMCAVIYIYIPIYLHNKAHTLVLFVYDSVIVPSKKNSNKNNNVCAHYMRFDVQYNITYTHVYLNLLQVQEQPQ